MNAESFRQTVVSAMGWSIVMKIGFQALTWAMTLLVIRVLSPSDYGLMTISQVFLSFMLGFSNLGLGDALVARKDVSPEVLASAFGLLIVVAVILAVALALAAYPIASWYGDARLTPLIQVSSLGFVFNAMTTLPRMSLSKLMRIRPIFAAELTSGLLGSIVVIALAYTGHGVWSLMMGWLATNISRQVVFLVVAHTFYVWPRFDFRPVWPLLGYGAFSTLEYLAWSVMTSADVLIVGRVLGAADLGLYTVVLNFAALPVNKIAPIVNSVAFPAFAMVQGRLEDARFYILKALRLASLLAIPVFLGIGSTAPEIVDIVFGPRWAAARPLLSILSVALIFRALLILVPNYLQGIGDAKAAFWCTAVGAVVFPPAILLGCSWGVSGACYSWLIAYPVVFAAEAVIASRRGSLSIRDVVWAPLRPFFAGAVMAGVVAVERSWLPGSLSDVARLACLSATGAATYAAVIALAFPALAGELRGLFRGRKPGLLV